MSSEQVDPWTCWAKKIPQWALVHPCGFYTILPMRFTKMHGCGNDYVYVDAYAQTIPDDLTSLARAVSDRHRGIGGDGLILLLPSDHADARMRMFNADGSESEMCGNGLRCIAKLAWDHQRVTTPHMRFETGAGILELDCLLDGQTCTGARVNMGKPFLDPADIPTLALKGATPYVSAHIELPDASTFEGIAVGMGNPHIVHFCDDAEQAPVTELGPLIEHHRLFPARTNVEFVSPLPGTIPTLRQRTWERGSGETQACGTGACAVTVAAMLSNRIPFGEACIELNGGQLHVEWDGQGPVFMSGEAITVFSGVW